MLLLVVLVLSGLELYRKECISEKGVGENEGVEAGEEKRWRAYLDPSKHSHASTPPPQPLHRASLVMFRRVGAGLGQWVCGTSASLPATAAAARPSSTIITSSSSRSLSVLASSTRTPHPFLLAQHQHMSQQQQQQLLSPSRGLSTSRDSSAAQHEAEAAEAAAREEGEDGLLEAPKPPRNSLVGVVVSDKMDKSIVVKVRSWVGLVWVVGWVWEGGGGEARGSAVLLWLCCVCICFLSQAHFSNHLSHESTYLFTLFCHRWRV